MSSILLQECHFCEFHNTQNENDTNLKFQLLKKFSGFV